MWAEKIAAGGGNGALTGDEFHAPSLTDLFGFTQQDAGDLSGLIDVRATAGGEIEIVDVDEAKFVPFGRRKFAQAELPCFLARDVADVDGTILEDDFVRQSLGGFDLLFSQNGRVQINRAVVVGHVERNRRNVEKADKCGGK